MNYTNTLTTGVSWLDTNWSDEYVDPVPTHLSVAGGSPLLYPGEINLICGRGGQGKTWLGVKAVLESAQQGEKALYVDYENGERWIRSRLKKLGMSRSEGTNVAHVHTFVPVSGSNAGELGEWITKNDIKLVVIDSLARALAAAGKDENSNTDIAWFFGTLEQLRSTGAAILVIDHVGHSNSDSFINKPRGASAKIDQISVAYYFSVQKPWSKNSSGFAWLICLKERFGMFIEEQVVAEMQVEVTPQGMVIRLVAPSNKVLDGVTRQDHAIRLLELLDKQGQITGVANASKVLAKELRIKPESALLVIDELVKQGYVARNQEKNGTPALLRLSDLGLSKLR